MSARSRPQTQKKTPAASSSKSSQHSAGSSSGDSRRTVSVQEPKTFNLNEIKEMTNQFGQLYGRGKYASVFKGEFNYKEIAVKKYAVDHITLAKNELDAFSSFGNSPNIIPLIGTCMNGEIGTCMNGESYFVMKFVPTNLDQHLQELNLDWKQTANVLKHLASAIRGVIMANYVVGDIKPDNILIDNKDHTAYLCDFGSAKKDGRGLPTVNAYYTAPEVVRSFRNGSPMSADIFSFGVILLQMIMRLNDFQELNSKISIDSQVKNYVPNRKDKTIPHITIYARLQLGAGNEHVVDKTLMGPGGCDLASAKKITDLGIKCTSDINGNTRPSIQDIITTLGELKI